MTEGLHDYCWHLRYSKLKSFGAVLIGMGLSGSALEIAVVAIAVYVLYLGVQAFCAEV